MRIFGEKFFTPPPPRRGRGFGSMGVAGRGAGPRHRTPRPDPTFQPAASPSRGSACTAAASSTCSRTSATLRQGARSLQTPGPLAALAPQRGRPPPPQPPALAGGALHTTGSRARTGRVPVAKRSYSRVSWRFRVDHRDRAVQCAQPLLPCNLRGGTNKMQKPRAVVVWRGFLAHCGRLRTPTASCLKCSGSLQGGKLPGGYGSLSWRAAARCCCASLASRFACR